MMKENQKIFLDRSDPALIKHFLAMCQDRQINRAKLTRAKFKAFLTIRYKGVIADKIKKYFNNYFRTPIDFEYFCDVFERFLNNLSIDRVQRLVHSIYDFNDDGKVDELDVYCFYTTFETENPELFMNIYY